METINQRFEDKFSFVNMETAEEEISFVVGTVKKFLLQKESFLHLFTFLDEEGFIKGIYTDNWHIKISSSGIVFELNQNKTSINLNFGRVAFYFNVETNCYAFTNYRDTIYFLEKDSEEDALKAFCLFFEECVTTLNNDSNNSIEEYNVFDEFNEMFDGILRYGITNPACHLSGYLL